MVLPGGSLPRVLLPMFVWEVRLAPTQCAYGSGRAPTSSNESQQTAQILSVRKVLRHQYFVSRYPQIHYYMLSISLRISEQTYCSEYETPVLDEIEDVTSTNGKSVEVVLTVPTDRYDKNAPHERCLLGPTEAHFEIRVRKGWHARLTQGPSRYPGPTFLDPHRARTALHGPADPVRALAL